MLSILSLDVAGGQKRAVAHLLHCQRAVLDGIDPPFHHSIPHVARPAKLHICLHKKGICIIVPPLHQTGKLVRMQTSADPFFPHKLCVYCSYAAKQTVTRRHPENIIYQFKIFNV